MTSKEAILSESAQLVQAALLERGLETPMLPCEFTPEERKDKIEHHMREVLTLMSLDLRDDSLADTPRRIAKIYVDDIFQVLITPTFPKLPLSP